MAEKIDPLSSIDDILWVDEEDVSIINKLAQETRYATNQIIEEPRMWIISQIHESIKKTSSWIYVDLSLIKEENDFKKSVDTIFSLWYIFKNLDYDNFIELVYNYDSFSKDNSIIKIADDIVEINKEKIELYSSFTKSNWEIYIRFINLEYWLNYVFEELLSVLWTKWIKFWFDKNQIINWINNCDWSYTLIAKDLNPILPQSSYVDYRWFELKTQIITLLEKWKTQNITFENFKTCKKAQIVWVKIPSSEGKEWRDIYWRVIKIPRNNSKVREITNFETYSWEWTQYLVLKSWEEVILSKHSWLVSIDEKRWIITIKDHLNINWNINNSNWNIFIPWINITILWDVNDITIEANDIFVEWNLYWNLYSQDWIIKIKWNISNWNVVNVNWQIICQWNIVSQCKKIKSINWKIDFSQVLNVELSTISWKEIIISNANSSIISWINLNVWQIKNCEIIASQLSVWTFESKSINTIFLILSWLKEIEKTIENISKMMTKAPSNYKELKKEFEYIYSKHKYLFDTYNFYNQNEFNKNMEDNFELYKKIKDKMNQDDFLESLSEKDKIRINKFIPLMEKIIRIIEIYWKIKKFLNIENDYKKALEKKSNIYKNNFIIIKKIVWNLSLRYAYLEDYNFLEHPENYISILNSNDKSQIIDCEKYISWWKLVYNLR